VKIESEFLSLNLEAPLRLAHGTSLTRHNVLTLDRNRLSSPCAKRTRMDCARSASSRLSLPLLTSPCTQPHPDSTEKVA
jgi:hypothetical protein